MNSGGRRATDGHAQRAGNASGGRSNAIQFRCDWCDEMLLDELLPDGSVESLAFCRCMYPAELVDPVRGLWRKHGR